MRKNDEDRSRSRFAFAWWGDGLQTVEKAQAGGGIAGDSRLDVDFASAAQAAQFPVSFIGLQRGRNSERSRIIGQIPDPTVRATIKDDLRALLHDPTIDAAWTAIADLCDQAMAGKAHLVGVGAQLYALDGAVTSFTEIIDGDPSWKNLATLFLRLSAHVIGAVQAPDALFRVLVIEVYPGYASALETGRGPIDENSGIEAAYRLLDMIGAYCLWSQAAAQGNPLP